MRSIYLGHIDLKKYQELRAFESEIIESAMEGFSGNLGISFGYSSGGIGLLIEKNSETFLIDLNWSPIRHTELSSEENALINRVWEGIRSRLVNS